MKVKDLVNKLLEFDQELPICLADWNEEYSPPSESAAELIKQVTEQYIPIKDGAPMDGSRGEGLLLDKFVKIG